MGNPLFELICNDCSHEHNIYIGWLSNGDFLSPYYCTNCREFKSITFNKSHEFKEKVCDVCNSELKHLNIKFPKEGYVTSEGHFIPLTVTPQVHCPKCKSANVKIIRAGVWD